MLRSDTLMAAALVAAALVGGPAHAQETPEPAAPTVSTNVDIGFASAYVFRGLNVFKATEQMDQHGFLAPAATVKLPSGLSFAYWGAYQLIGSNTSTLLDGGVGGENDLTVGYDHPLMKDLTLGFTLTWYVYPFAKEQANLVPSLPSYLEPAAKLTWSSVVDLSMRVLYFAGVQNELKAYRYLYLNPAAAKRFEFSRLLALDVGLGLGLKVGSADLETALNGNLVDVLASAALTVHVTDTVYLKPNVNLAWTNVKNAPGAVVLGEAPKAGTFGDGVAFFGGLNLGADL